MPNPKLVPAGLTAAIEFPSRHVTFIEWEFGVYGYGVYPRSSVLAGQERRVWLGGYPTLAAARADYPTAEVTPPAAEQDANPQEQDSHGELDMIELPDD